MREPASCALCPLDSYNNATKLACCFVTLCCLGKPQSLYFCHDPIDPARHAEQLHRWDASAWCRLLSC